MHTYIHTRTRARAWVAIDLHEGWLALAILVLRVQEVEGVQL